MAKGEGKLKTNEMLKFVKQHMETIDGIATYPMISLLIFFVFFSLLFWWVLTASKSHIEHMGQLPLDGVDDKSLNNDYDI